MPTTIDLGTTDNTRTFDNADYIITAGNGNNTLTFGTGIDLLTLGNGNNTLTLGGGKDQITAGSGNNTVTTTGAGADTVTLTSGNNTVVLGDGPNVVQAGDGLNIVTVGNGNDSITLGNGFDTVTTGNGNGTITAGNGVGDKITVGNGANTIAIGTGSADVVHTGSGGNTLTVSGAAVGADAILGALTSGDGTNNKLILTTAGVISPLGVSGFQIYQLANGGPNNLTLTNANFSRLPGASITVVGGNGANTVNAAALAVANSVIVNAGPGADVITGGAGNDLVNVSDTAFSSVDGGSGVDTLALKGAGLSLDLGAFVNRIKNVENIDLTGTGNNTLVLNAADVLNLSGTSSPVNTLKVTGNAGDAVSVLDSGWVTGATAGGFTTYTNGTAILLLNTALSASGGIGTPFDKTPPVFVNDNPLAVLVGGTAVITTATLNVTDTGSTASQLTYTITNTPARGVVLKSSVPTTQFTQADINAGLISYQENGSSATSDTISVAVTDPAGNSVTGSLPVVIGTTADTTFPVFVNDNPLAVSVAGTATITSSTLMVTDATNPASQLTYTVTSAPTRGTVLKSGVVATQFTQADINAGLIAYQENGSSATADTISLAVSDTAGNTITGSLPIVISATADTTPPAFVNDKAVTVLIGGVSPITSASLMVTDAGNTASQLTYTITSAPSHGTVLKNAVATTKFTQADIDAGQITFQENGSLATSDTISLAVTDQAGNTLNGSLPIVISAATDTTPPAFVNDKKVSVLVGGATTITSASLSVTDPTNSASQLTYTITSGPSNGTVLKNAVATTKFTQADIDAGTITYQQNGGGATSDAIALTVADPSGNSISGTLPIAVTTGLVNTLGTGQQIELLYIGYFNRAADGGGLTFWQGQNTQAQTKGQSASIALSNIANSFMPQTEAIALYPFMATANPNLQSPAEQAGINNFITSIYNNLFSRAPDVSGKAYWVGQLSSGVVPVGNAVLAISNGATGSDAPQVQIKIAVTVDFTTRTNAANLGGTPPLTSSFNTAAHGVLNGVDGTSLNDASTTSAMASTTTYINSSTSGGGATLGTGLSSSDNAIVISTSNVVIDPGAGSHTIQFIPGAAGDTLVLHGGGTDQIAGFDVDRDVLDLRGLLAERGSVLRMSCLALVPGSRLLNRGRMPR